MGRGSMPLPVPQCHSHSQSQSHLLKQAMALPNQITTTTTTSNGVSASACDGESAAAAAAPVVTTVDVTAASDLITSSSHRYVDVRAAEEMEKGHLHNSLNVPYMFLTPQGSREKNPLFVEQFSAIFSKDQHVVVGCQSGKRSELACIDLLAAGFKNVKNMGGGYIAWLDKGFPVHKPSPPPN